MPTKIPKWIRKPYCKTCGKELYQNNKSGFCQLHHFVKPAKCDDCGNPARRFVLRGKFYCGNCYEQHL